MSYTPPPHPHYVVVASTPASGVATASMVFGIIGLLIGWCTLGIPCIVAVICGHMGMSQTSGGRMAGRGQAVAGLIMGYLALAPAIILFFLFVVGSIGAAVDPATTPTP